MGLRRKAWTTFTPNASPILEFKQQLPELTQGCYFEGLAHNIFKQTWSMKLLFKYNTFLPI